MKRSRMDNRTIYVDWRDAPSATEFSKMLVNAISIEDDHFDLDCEFIERKLTDQERLIFDKLREGYSVREIAPMIGYCVRTVYYRIEGMREKIKELL